MSTPQDEAPGLQWLRRLRYQKAVFFAVLLVVFAVSALVILRLPNEYAAHLKFAVKNDRVDPMLASGKATQGILYVNDVSEARINTEIQLLTSTNVLGEVVRRSGLSEWHAKPRWTPARRDAEALRRLQKELEVAPVRNSSVIAVTYQTTDPQRSVAVLRNLWAAYTEASRDMHGVPGSLEFFERLSREYAAQLATAEASLSAFRESHHVVALAEEQSLALANVAHLKGELADASALEQQGTAEAAAMQREESGMPSRVERGRRSLPNQALVADLEAQRVKLENKRTEAAGRYQPGDRVVRELDAQLAQTEAALLRAQTSVPEEVSTAANPTLDVARSEYLHAAATESGARAQKEELRRQLGREAAKAAGLAAASATFKQLTQKVADLEELTETYRKKTEDARMEKLLDQERISGVTLVETPLASPVPSSPKRGLLLVVSVVWAALLAFIVAMVREALTGRVRSPEECRALGGTALLTQVPTLLLPAGASETFAELYGAMQRDGMSPAATEGVAL